MRDVRAQLVPSPAAENGQIEKFDNDGTFLTSWSVGGTTFGLTVDATGRVFAGTKSPDEVLVFDENGSPLFVTAAPVVDHNGYGGGSQFAFMNGELFYVVPGSPPRIEKYACP